MTLRSPPLTSRVVVSPENVGGAVESPPWRRRDVTVTSASSTPLAPASPAASASAAAASVIFCMSIMGTGAPPREEWVCIKSTLGCTGYSLPSSTPLAPPPLPPLLLLLPLLPLPLECSAAELERAALPADDGVMLRREIAPPTVLRCDVPPSGAPWAPAASLTRVVEGLPAAHR